MVGSNPHYIYIYHISPIHSSPWEVSPACHAGPIVQLMQQRSSFPLSRLQDPWGPLVIAGFPPTFTLSCFQLGKQKKVKVLGIKSGSKNM